MLKLSLLLVLVIFTASGIASPPKKQQVCVIGAGPSGIHATRILSLYPDEFEAIVFEKQSDVGGLWNYTDSTTFDEHGLPVHTSLYKYQRINYPKELQRFVDYPFFKGDESKGQFVDHTEMLQYLKNYTEHFNLRQYMKFDTNVEHISPLPRMRWLVATRNLNTHERSETECDAVIIANGNNVKGHVPKLPGIENFTGRVMHSHVYRIPEVFANQTVVVLGASFSGTDISIDISRFAEKVYLSHRHDRLSIELPSNVEQALGVAGAEGDELILSDGSRIKANAMVLCTGYDYDYPFLDKSSGIYVDGNGKWVRPVYKHIINIERPTMAILNLPTPGLPFIIARPQAAYFIATLRKKLILPSREEMLKDAALPPGVPKSKAHFKLQEILPYYDELAAAAGDVPLPKTYANGLLDFLPHLLFNPMNFRDKTVLYNEDGTVILV